MTKKEVGQTINKDYINMEHLFKLKKDEEKLVGYLLLKCGAIFWKTKYEGDEWTCNPEFAFEWATAYPFVTKDRNGKDVFADDPVWLHWKGKKTEGQIIKEGLFWKYKSHEGYSRILCKFDISYIELIEEKEND